MPCPGDPANSVYVSLGLNANVGSRPGPAGCGDTYQANYETFGALITARARNLITADETEIVECYDDWPSGLFETSINIENYTLDSTHTMIIRSAQGNKPVNIPEDGFYIGGGVTVFRIFQDYTTVKNIGIVSLATASTHYAIRVYGQDFVEIDGCFLRCTGNQGRNIRADTTGSDVNVRNCFIFGGAWGIDFGGIGNVAWNNTIRGTNTAGINSTSGSARVRNNVVFAKTGGSEFTVSTTNVGGNVSQDGTAPGSVYTITNPANEFVGSDGSDMHLLETCGFRGLGNDLSAAIEYPFNDDIDGDTRSVPWDPGADEFVGAPPSATQNAIFHGANF